MAKQTKEEKARKARERQAALKAEGLTRDQRRNLGKAIKKDETLLDKVSNFLYRTFDGVEDAANQVIDKADELNSNLNATLTDIPTFAEYVSMHPEMSMNRLKKSYRDLGGKIGNSAAGRITREVKDVPYDYKKNTSKKGIKYYPPKHNPRHKGLIIKKRYQYYVSYYVRVDEFIYPENRFATIASDEKLDADEVLDHLETMFDQMRTHGETSKEEKYKGLDIVYDDPNYPVRILYAIDSKMK